MQISKVLAEEGEQFSGGSEPLLLHLFARRDDAREVSVREVTQDRWSAGERVCPGLRISLKCTFWRSPSVRRLLSKTALALSRLRAVSFDVR